MAEDKFDAFTIKMAPEDRKRYEELANSKSGTGRMILKTWMDAVEEHDLKEEPEQINLAILYSYKNAIEKHIESLKLQRDKLQTAIDDAEDDDEEDEILFEIDLKMKRKHL